MSEPEEIFVHYAVFEQRVVCEHKYVRAQSQLVFCG